MSIVDGSCEKVKTNSRVYSFGNFKKGYKLAPCSRFIVQGSPGFSPNFVKMKTVKEQQPLGSVTTPMQSSPEVKAPSAGKSLEKILVLDPLDLKRCENELAPLEFILPGMLAGTVGALIAPGGAGKSMLGLEVAIAVSTGMDLAHIWHRGLINTGKVLYLPAEDPRLVVMHRVRAMLAHLPLSSRTEMYDRLTVNPMIGRGCDLMAQEWQSAIEKAAESQKLIILDTLSRYHTLEENSADQMSQLLRVLEKIAEKTCTSILFLHHVNKSSVWNDVGDAQQATRGSSVLTDNVRWQGNLVNMSLKEATRLNISQEMRRNYVRLAISKINYGPSIPDRWLRRVEGGVLVPVTDEAIRRQPKRDAQGKLPGGMLSGVQLQVEGQNASQTCPF